MTGDTLSLFDVLLLALLPTLGTVLGVLLAALAAQYVIDGLKNSFVPVLA